VSHDAWSAAPVASTCKRDQQATAQAQQNTRASACIGISDRDKIKCACACSTMLHTVHRQLDSNSKAAVLRAKGGGGGGLRGHTERARVAKRPWQTSLIGLRSVGQLDEHCAAVPVGSLCLDQRDVLDPPPLFSISGHVARPGLALGNRLLVDMRCQQYLSYC